MIVCLTVFDTAWAAPKSGLGIHIGYVWSADQGTTKVTNTPVTTKGKGAGYGLDYQMAVGSATSMTVFLDSSGETISGDFIPPDTRGRHRMIGLELATWWNWGYLGAYYGQAQEAIYPPSNSGLPNSTGIGQGYGLVIGEDKGTGFYGTLRLETGHIALDNADMNYKTVRLSTGYRWL